MTESFRCPSCNAPLRYEAGDGAVITCEFCNNSILVPENMRGAAPRPGEANTDQIAQLEKIIDLIHENRQIEAIKLYRSTFNVGLAEAKQAVDQLTLGQAIVLGMGANPTVVYSGGGRRVGCLVTVIMLIILASIFVPLLAGGGLTVFTVGQVTTQIQELVSEEGGIELPGALATVLPLATATPQPTATPAYAELVQQFGGEGIGPGKLNDTRAIAVAGTGNLYLGDYQGGRIQVLDPAGDFVSQWSANPELPLRSLAVDRRGVAYLVQQSKIFRYEAASGSPLGEMPTAGHLIDQVVVNASGQVLAMGDFIDDTIVRFNPDGQVDQVFEKVVSSHLGVNEPLIEAHLAVDGAGAMYVLARYAGTEVAVFMFSPDGSYINRFGSYGDAPDQFSLSASAIAVDSQGRIYVGDSQRILVFSSAGRYLGDIEVSGVIFGLAITDQDDIYATNRSEVYLFRPVGQ
ncbi:MAG: hypothetical protein H6666_17840 [Ardenticatenaceae bacterium]|nr:hypothetical protein [Ardenticatenaceae bacterium]